MRLFETHEASKILDLPEDRIRSCVRAGFLEPERGPDRKYRFTFQDLLVLKTTKGLLDSGVPARRISRLLNSLRRQISADLHLASLTIYADGSKVVVWDGSARWEPGSGQFLFDFDPPPARQDLPAAASQERSPGASQDLPPAARHEPALTALRAGIPDLTLVATMEPEAPAAKPERPAMVRRPAPERRPSGDRDPTPGTSPPRWTPVVIDISEIAARAGVETRADSSAARGLDAEQWFELACELEGESRDEARQAYHRALALDPTMADAHVNLGRQYHEIKDFAKAEAHYRAAAQYAPEDPIVWFNLGVLLDDLKRPHEGIHAYREAIGRDDDYADAHYNLGLLLDSLGRRSEAITHLMKARRLYGRSKRQ